MTLHNSAAAQQSHLQLHNSLLPILLKYIVMVVQPDRLALFETTQTSVKQKDCPEATCVMCRTLFTGDHLAFTREPAGVFRIHKARLLIFAILAPPCPTWMCFISKLRLASSTAVRPRSALADCCP